MFTHGACACTRTHARTKRINTHTRTQRMLFIYRYVIQITARCLTRQIACYFELVVSCLWKMPLRIILFSRNNNRWFRIKKDKEGFFCIFPLVRNSNTKCNSCSYCCCYRRSCGRNRRLNWILVFLSFWAYLSSSLSHSHTHTHSLSPLTVSGASIQRISPRVIFFSIEEAFFSFFFFLYFHLCKNSISEWEKNVCVIGRRIKRKRSKTTKLFFNIPPA